MAEQKSRITYDEVVAALHTLDTEEQINLLEALSSELRKSVSRKVKKHSLLELEGLGADAWSKLDVESYVSSERDSWN